MSVHKQESRGRPVGRMALVALVGLVAGVLAIAGPGASSVGAHCDGYYDTGSVSVWWGHEGASTISTCNDNGIVIEGTNWAASSGWPKQFARYFDHDWKFKLCRNQGCTGNYYSWDA